MGVTVGGKGREGERREGRDAVAFTDNKKVIECD